MAKKRGKKVIRRPRVIKLKPVEHKTNHVLATYSFVLSVISLIVLLAYLVAALTADNDPTLLLFTYLAALVIFIIATFGVALSTADLMAHPKNELSKKALYLNLIILAVTFALLLFKIV